MDGRGLTSKLVIGVAEERALCGVLLQVSTFSIGDLNAVRSLGKDLSVKFELLLASGSFESKCDLTSNSLSHLNLFGSECMSGVVIDHEFPEQPVPAHKRDESHG